jgi:hypothetical protein
MIREFVVGIAMLWADYASNTRMASRRAIRLDLDPML